MSKVVIVGGGVAGLAAGIKAELCGFDVQLIEKNKNLGGNLTGWTRGGCHIDNYIHWLTGTDPDTAEYGRWTELGVLGNGMEVYYPKSLYSCGDGTHTLSLWSDIEKTREELIALSPSDEKRINRLIAAVKATISIMKGKQKGRLGSFMSAAKYHFMSTGKLSSQFSHPLIRRFFTALLGNNFSALALVVVFAVFCGGNGGIPKGGSLAAAKRMEERFVSLGGQVTTGKRAVSVKGGEHVEVTLSDGEKIYGDYAVITGDPKTIYGAILAAEMPDRLAKMYKSREISRFSSFHVAFCVDEKDVGFNGDMILELPETLKPYTSYRNVVLREFSYEKGYAPEGKTVVTAMVFCDESSSRKFISLRNNMAAYNAVKRHISNLLKCFIAERYPAFERAETIDCWTPATYRRYCLSEIGSYMAFTLPPRYVPLPVRQEVNGEKNIFVASQWNKLPGGLPNAAAAGYEAVENIVKAEKRKKPATFARVSEQKSV